MTAPKAKTLQERMGFVDHDLTTPLHDELMRCLETAVKGKDTLGRWLMRYGWHPERTPAIEVTNTTWEYPINNDRKFTVGFIDLMVSYIDRAKTTNGAESPLVQQVYFEVKTAIQSLGELLRQLRLYELHVKGPIFVVCPENRFAETIRAQGFGVILAYTCRDRWCFHANTNYPL